MVTVRKPILRRILTKSNHIKTLMWLRNKSGPKYNFNFDQLESKLIFWSIGVQIYILIYSEQWINAFFFIHFSLFISPYSFLFIHLTLFISLSQFVSSLTKTHEMKKHHNIDPMNTKASNLYTDFSLIVSFEWVILFDIVYHF